MQFFSTVVIVVVGTFNLVRIFTHKILSDKDKWMNNSHICIVRFSFFLLELFRRTKRKKHAQSFKKNTSFDYY